MFIRKMCINGLFGYCNFEYIFTHNHTVFVGENGIGKSTVLSLLYHFLRGNITEILKYRFDDMTLELEDNSLIKLDYPDLYEYSRFDKRPMARREKNYYKNDVFNLFLKNLDLFTFEFGAERQDIERAFELANRKGISVSSSRILMELDRVKHLKCHTNPNLLNYLRKVEEVSRTYTILYFPTYRRIEEDFTSIKIITRDDDDEDNDFDSFGQNQFRRPDNSLGELIQFGMTDVKRTIRKLLDTIKKQSIDGFNKMTGDLLLEYVDNKVQDQNMVFLSKDQIDIALTRAGITNDLKNKIIEHYEETKFDTNHNLSILISNLVKKNEQLSPIDQKLNDFAEICNRYLCNKMFVYNPSAVTLEMRTCNNSSDNISDGIDLSDLSSGEKQIVSTFAKMYLENNEHIILLFDEPELSLSIEWQRNFIKDITSLKNCKFSISVTHSPYIFENMLENAQAMDQCMSYEE